jgi:hypothetical protein
VAQSNGAPKTPAPAPRPAPQAGAPPSFIVACSSCRQQVRVPESAVGKAVKCPQCAAVFTAAPPAPKPPSSPAVFTPEIVGPASKPASARKQSGLSPQQVKPGTAPKKTAPTPQKAPANAPNRSGLRKGPPPTPARRPSPAAKSNKTLKIVALCGGAGVVIAGAFLALFFLGVFGSKTDTTPGNDNSGKKTLDVAFIAKDFNGAMVLHPKRILEKEMLKDLPQDKLFEVPIKAFDVDPRKIEQVILLTDPYGSGSTPVFPAAIVRFAEKVDGKKLIQQILRANEEKSLSGKTYYKPPQGVNLVPGISVCGHVADERTLLVAPELTLQKMLSAKEEKSPLTDALRTVDPDSDMVGVFSVTDPMRKLMGEQLKGLKGHPLPFLNKAAELHDHLQTVTVALNLTGDTLLKIDLEGKDENSATYLHDLAKKAHDFVKVAYSNDTKKKLQATEYSEQIQPIIAVLDEIFEKDGIKINKDGLHTIVQVPTPKGLTDLPKKLQPFIKELMSGPPKKKEPIRDQAIAWVKANKAANRDETFVTQVNNTFNQQFFGNMGFCLHLGTGLVKSQKQTLLCGWGGELFVFELTADQEKISPLNPNSSVLQTIWGNEPIRGRPQVKLSPPDFDQADKLDPAKKITGSVAFKKLAQGKGPYNLRLILMNGRGTYQQAIGAALPEDKTPLKFSFRSLNESLIEHTGPLPVVMDVVSAELPGLSVPVSNSVAVLLNVPKGKEPPPGGGDVLAAIKELGGQPLHKDFNPTSPVIGASFSFKDKFTNETLAKLKRFPNLEELNLAYTKVTGAGLTHLAGFTKLRVLNLGGIKLGDADLAHLAKLTSLERLPSQLVEDVTDKGLEHLSALTKLQELYLGYSKITDAGLAHLQKMKDMRMLSVIGTNGITGTGLVNLKGMDKLVTIDLNWTKVDDAALAHLAGLTELNEVRLGNTSVTDKGLAELKKLKKLKSLVLDKASITGTGLKDVPFMFLYAGGSKFNDDGLKAIAGNTKVWNLTLWGTQVTDDGLKHVSGMQELTSLILDQTKVTGTGLAALKGLKHLYSISLYKAAVTDDGLKFVKDLSGSAMSLVLDGCPIGDKGLEHFKGLDNFSSLSLSETKVTDAGLAKLEGLTKATRIALYRTAVTKQGVDKLKKVLTKCAIEFSPAK